MSDEVEKELEIIPLTDEEGNEHDFALLALLPIDGNTYAVLSPVEDLESDEPELDLYAFAWDEDEEGNLELDAVEDDELLAAIMKEAEKVLFDDLGDGED